MTDGMWLISVSSSGVLPLKVIIMVVSFCRIKPRSPCRASAGCRHAAWIPSELNVAESLVAMWPDLPMPVNMTLP